MEVRPREASSREVGAREVRLAQVLAGEIRSAKRPRPALRFSVVVGHDGRGSIGMRFGLERRL